MVEPWVELEEQVVHDGRLRIARRRFRRQDGGEGDYEVLLHGAVACVLALTSEDRVVLVHQFRPGPQRLLYDLPVGFVDEGESPEAAAHRELAEETGYGGTLRHVGALHNHGYSTEVRHVFVSTDAHRVGDPAPDPGEEIDVELVDMAELRRLLRSGRITVTDAAYVALDALGRLS